MPARSIAASVSEMSLTLENEKEITVLELHGWDDRWASLFATDGEADLIPARVVSTRERMSQVVTADGVELAWNSLPPARLRSATGDWVRITRERFERGQPKQPHMRTRARQEPERPVALRAMVSVLPRRSALRRRLDGPPDSDGHVLAANVDTVMVVAPLVPPMRDAAVLRYLALAVDSAAAVQVVLTKMDLHPAPGAERGRVSAVVARGWPVWAASGTTGDGVESLRTAPGSTTILIGPSGGGKSTLINRIFGLDLQRTRAVSRKGTGRHTTTTNQLHVMPDGRMLVDTPGVQNVGGAIPETILDTLFPEVAEVGTQCRYSNCDHDREPGCAVRERVAPDRFSLWRSAQRRSEQRR